MATFIKIIAVWLATNLLKGGAAILLSFTFWYLGKFILWWEPVRNAWYNWRTYFNVIEWHHTLPAGCVIQHWFPLRELGGLLGPYIVVWATAWTFRFSYKMLSGAR